MCSKEVLEKIKTKMAQSYREVFGEDLVDVYLYGSYARGDYDDYSDIDIAGIVNGDRLKLQKQLEPVSDVGCDLGYDNDIIVSPTVIPYDEFQRYNTILPYYINILKEGQKIG